MLSTMKTMLFVSLALASNAALPPGGQEAAEEDRIRSSPHLNELIGHGPKFGITKMESVRPSERQRAGYDIMNQYTVSARTHGEGCWMTQQGYIERDFTVYVVHSKFEVGQLCGPVIFGLMFEDYYVEDPMANNGDGQFGYVNHAKPVTKVPADCNGVKPAIAPIGPGGIGPAYTRGEIEAPAGTKVIFLSHMRSYTIRVYTPEQQARLGVDEYGRRVNRIKLNPKSKVQCLPSTDTIGYITEGRMVGTFGHDDPLPSLFRSADESVVACKLVRIAGLCGGEIYEHQFIAKNFGRTTVTNGSTTYTIQVGLLHDNIKTDPGFDLQ